LFPACELGLLGLTVAECDGGAGLDATAAVIVHEALPDRSGFALAYPAHSVLFVNNFYRNASANAGRFLAPTCPAPRGRYVG
jgi:isovaleryl-CoA dehydrogenase